MYDCANEIPSQIDTEKERVCVFVCERKRGGERESDKEIEINREMAEREIEIEERVK